MSCTEPASRTRAQLSGRRQLVHSTELIPQGCASACSSLKTQVISGKAGFGCLVYTGPVVRWLRDGAVFSPLQRPGTRSDVLTSLTLWVIFSTPGAMFVFIHFVGLWKVGFLSPGALMTDLKRDGQRASVVLRSLPAPLQTFHSLSVTFSLHRSRPISSVRPKSGTLADKALSSSQPQPHQKASHPPSPLVHLTHCVTSLPAMYRYPVLPARRSLIHPSTKCPGELVNGSANQPKMLW